MAQTSDIDSRFSTPSDWQWHAFERLQGRNIRYGFAIPEAAEKVIIYLPGLAEPAEKSFETGNEMLKRGYGFAVMDWFGQGGSGRYLSNPHKRHAGAFEEDLADFHEFISKISSQTKGKKLIMLAHSMGGNLGLRYLHDHPETFEKAAFIAPMIGIYALKALPPFLRNSVSAFMNKTAAEHYITGGSDWSEGNFKTKLDKQILSSDPARVKVQDQLFSAHPNLAVGDVTYGWVYQAQKSCALLQRQISNIQTHVLLACAGKDWLVDSDAIKKAHGAMPHSTLLQLPHSRHEILMERDDIRNRFLEAFYDLI